MKRTAYWVLGLFLLAAVVSMFLLSHYRGELVYTVVRHATLQKAPSEQQAGIEAAFERARHRASQPGREHAYLETLFAISQRLEKVQALSRQGSDEIVRLLNDFSQKRPAR
ncbi:MAG: hypothetical protein HYX74_04905 [Acidobacteria bacterium]|nr:hypothetical protein [Acidobacteriota bacterium]